MPLTTITPKPIIFSDLDGTLLDPVTYDFESARPALDVIRRRDIPLVLVSSKTRREIEHYRSKLENPHPFISENGGGVFIPRGYFSFPFPYDREVGPYGVVELGTPYPVLLVVFKALKEEILWKITGFSELTDEALCSLTGLSLEEVRWARQREYGEAFLVEGGEEAVAQVRKKIEEKGMTYVWGGRFHHLLGKNDKGKAVQILKTLYKIEFFSIVTIGIGDSQNDLPMLSAVDQPIFLKREDDPLFTVPSEIRNLKVIEGTGPKAWAEALLRVLSS